jgi:hypothetical protein
MTEIVTTSGNCLVGSVETGKGCDILQNGRFEVGGCEDNFGLCFPSGSYPADSCKWLLTQSLLVCDKLVQVVVIPFTVYNNADSCWTNTPTRNAGPPLPPPRCDTTHVKKRQINRDAPPRPETPVTGQHFNSQYGLSGIKEFDIPIGTESGDSLFLYRFAFIPDGWSYAISDSNWIHTPDTVHVTINHDDIIAEEDTARVVIYAYNDRDEYAGYAEVMVYEPGAPVSVEEIPWADLPTTYNLGQNYPNPFNPSTTIEFAVPNRTIVSIEVLNILGQRVRSLVEEELPSGRFRISWDGTDENGTSVATGVYLYRFRAGDYVETKKMLLMK